MSSHGKEGMRESPNIDEVEFPSHPEVWALRVTLTFI